jgi:hypothetical protein
MTIRELGTVCLAPVILIGYLSHIQVASPVLKNSTFENATMIEVQTCDKGIGFEAKAATNGLYGAGFQYGFKFEPVEKFSITVTPKFGMSYVDHPVRELPQRTQFGLGGQVLFGYENFRVGLEWWHMSNGSALGLNATEKKNIGLDLIAIQTGWVF